MINEIKADAQERMQKGVEALGNNFNKIRTGRTPSLLDGISVSYYGVNAVKSVGHISVLDARTLSVSLFDKQATPEIEKAIMKSDLWLNPVTTGELMRIPMPPLTEKPGGYITGAL